MWRRCFQSGPTSTPPCSTGLTWKSSTLGSGSCRWVPRSHGIAAHSQVLCEGERCRSISSVMWCSWTKCPCTTFSSVSTKLGLGLSHVVFLCLFCHLEKGAFSLADTTKNFKTPRRVNVIIKKTEKAVCYTLFPFF